jgi:hypothetical protein
MGRSEKAFAQAGAVIHIKQACHAGVIIGQTSMSQGVASSHVFVTVMLLVTNASPVQRFGP